MATVTLKMRKVASKNIDTFVNRLTELGYEIENGVAYANTEICIVVFPCKDIREEVKYLGSWDGRLDECDEYDEKPAPYMTTGGYCWFQVQKNPAHTVWDEREYGEILAIRDL